MNSYTLQDHPIHQKIYELCQQIEKCGCSTELTQAVMMASNLQYEVAKLRNEQGFFIPTLGATYRLTSSWTFSIWYEMRNDNFIEDLKNDHFATLSPRKKDQWGTYSDSLAGSVTLPEGTELKIERIYVRRNQTDFDSVTFRTKFDGKRGPIKGRFWVKLADANKIKATLV